MFFARGRANRSCKQQVRLLARLFESVTRRSVKLGIGYAGARQHSTSWYTDDATANYAKNTRVHRTAARPDAAEVARRADAVGATTDSNARARRRQRDGCTPRPRWNWQETKEAEEGRGASMAYLR